MNRPMFTGIVEALGRVASIRSTGSARVLRIDTPDVAASLTPGDSVSVNGVCLTVERADGAGFEATAVAETIARTTLGDLAAGSRVNLERAATMDRLFGGHIVQGHIDGVGRVVRFEGHDAGDWTLEVELPSDVHDLCVDKGSIALDGISLTIARRLSDGRVSIAIVPHTLSHTVVSDYVTGSRVNVEADVVARYVREYVRRYQPVSR
jgi:riboflavin synthase